jgi:hypothetical protein
MKLLFLSILIVPGLACLYALILRPLLHRIPALARFYAQADGFWQKLWALCGKSVTMAWSYLLAAGGTVFALLDTLAGYAGDPALGDQVKTALQNHPEYIGYFTIGVSLLTILSRVRTLGKGA